MSKVLAERVHASRPVHSGGMYFSDQILRGLCNEIQTEKAIFGSGPDVRRRYGGDRSFPRFFGAGAPGAPGPPATHEAPRPVAPHNPRQTRAARPPPPTN